MDILEKLNAKKEAKRFVVISLIRAGVLLVFSVTIFLRLFQSLMISHFFSEENVISSAVILLIKLVILLMVLCLFVVGYIPLFSKKFKEALDKTGWIGKTKKEKTLYRSD